jgi:hypothetical protein
VQAFLLALGIVAIFALTPSTGLAEEAGCPAAFEVQLETDGNAKISVDARLHHVGPETPVAYYVQLLDPDGREEYRSP